jgi:hypothetical protein
MSGKKHSAKAHSAKAIHNADIEDLRNKLSRTVYSIVAFHIVNTGVKITHAETKRLSAKMTKAMHEGIAFVEQYRR